ncbi:hypothetical protein ACHQM5_020354 [Ranunculus cassubicifolius]
MDDSAYDTDDEITDVVVAACATIILCVVGWYEKTYIDRYPSLNGEGERSSFMKRLTNGNDNDCHHMLRMNKIQFYTLCELLRNKGGLKDSRYVPLEEQVAYFLHTIGHDVRNRVVKFDFIRSGETVHRHFNRVLDAVISLYKHLVKRPEELPYPEIMGNPRYVYFKDCMGALDGTHIPAKVPLEEQGTYRNRKKQISQNVLGACTMDMKFTYVLAGWEGSAADGKVLQSALHREDSIPVPVGNYYLVDAGYANAPGFLAPYRGVRYHLNEWKGRTPQTPKELFNHRHSSLRNVIERTFGLIKKRWAVLCSVPHYNYDMQVKIVIACCVVHNHIMNVDPNDPLLPDVDRELQNRETPTDDLITDISYGNGNWHQWRDELAEQMFAEYRA